MKQRYLVVLFIVVVVGGTYVALRSLLHPVRLASALSRIQDFDMEFRDPRIDPWLRLSLKDSVIRQPQGVIRCDQVLIRYRWLSLLVFRPTLMINCRKARVILASQPVLPKPKDQGFWVPSAYDFHLEDTSVVRAGAVPVEILTAGDVSLQWSKQGLSSDGRATVVWQHPFVDIGQVAWSFDLEGSREASGEFVIESETTKLKWAANEISTPVVFSGKMSFEPSTIEIKAMHVDAAGFKLEGRGVMSDWLDAAPKQRWNIRRSEHRQRSELSSFEASFDGRRWLVDAALENKDPDAGQPLYRMEMACSRGESCEATGHWTKSGENLSWQARSEGDWVVTVQADKWTAEQSWLDVAQGLHDLATLTPSLVIVGINVKRLDVAKMHLRDFKTSLRLSQQSAQIDEIFAYAFKGFLKANGRVVFDPLEYVFNVNLGGVQTSSVLERWFPGLRGGSLQLKGQMNGNRESLVSMGHMKLESLQSSALGTVFIETLKKSIEELKKHAPSLVAQTDELRDPTHGVLKELKSDYRFESGILTLDSMEGVAESGFSLTGKAEVDITNRQVAAALVMLDPNDSAGASSLSPQVSGRGIKDIFSDEKKPLGFEVQVGCSLEDPCPKYEAAIESLTQLGLRNTRRHFPTKSKRKGRDE